MNLDDLARFHSLDPHNFLAYIDALPGQVAAAWTLGQSLSLGDQHRAARQAVIVGRGDSALAGDVARLAAEAGQPVTVWAEPGLPAWAGPDTLVIALSHSGNTPETLASVERALAQGAPILAITAGGQLGTRPLTVWRYPPEGDARTALGYLAMLTLAALTQWREGPDPSGAVAEAVAALQKQQAQLNAESPVSRNPAKRMAGQLLERYAVLFVADELAPAGRRWQGQINQLAKAWAQCIPLAEADHAQAGRLFPEALIDKYMTLFLCGDPAPQLDAVRMAFMTSGFNTDFIRAAGQTRLAQLFTLMHYGDYAAYYLAMGYGVDPAARLE